MITYRNHPARAYYRNRNCHSSNQTSNSPSVNVTSTDESYQIAVVAPGLEKEDFKIDIENSVLKISGKAKEALEKNIKVLRNEFSFKEFERAFELPEDIDLEKIDASYKQGILNVNLPIKEEAPGEPTREISIN